MTSERYARQEIIKEWNQEKIRDVRVALVGSERLSDIILADMLAIGIENVIRIGCSDFFEFGKLNPTAYIEQKNEKPATIEHAKFLIGNSDFVIDATNNFDSKRVFFEVAREKGLEYISVYSDLYGFSLINKRSNECENSLANENYHAKQGDINSIICGALATDELRKIVMSSENERMLDKFRYRGIEKDLPLRKKVVQIGAGAIGTFSALALALMDIETTIIDYDVVEESNLNRQFLFYDSIGLNKAEVLVERLRKYSTNLKAIDMKVEAGFNPEGYDVILSCVDNNLARYYLNTASMKHKVPLINAGSSLLAGNAMCYYPEKTACLDCQTNFKLSNALLEDGAGEQKNKGCFQQQPSLIFSNQVVGGLMINCWLKSLENEYKKNSYSSGFGIYEQAINPVCFDSCKTKFLVKD